MSLSIANKIGVCGAGTMGNGIAQITATFGHEVVVYDQSDEALSKAKAGLIKIMNRLVEKGRLEQSESEQIIGRIEYTNDLNKLSDSGLVIEAIIENLEIKKTLFQSIEELVAEECILASNTSSLSIASISSALKKPERFLGIHFFNPAPLMPLVEIIPGVATDHSVTDSAKKLIADWGKTTVLAKDTPGFIVNRVARPFYSESIRMLEEGVADAATIDWALTELGGFRMGPFTLMDFIGHDVNYIVTETVFEAFFYDPRFKPSFTQKRLYEAGFLGRKTGRGFYDYHDGATNPEPNKDYLLGKYILNRVLVMLINEAIDAVFMNVASKEDVELAMTKGVNYPKGLLHWADEIGLEHVLTSLQELQNEYGEDRYRPNPLLKRMVTNKKTFFGAS